MSKNLLSLEWLFDSRRGRAFLRLELHWFATGISWYEAKLALVRDAIRAYLAAPRFVLMLYYPLYHSKYNPIERCWGILERHS